MRNPIIDDILEEFKSNRITKEKASELLSVLLESEYKDGMEDSGDFRDNVETQEEYFGKRGDR